MASIEVDATTALDLLTTSVTMITSAAGDRRNVFSATRVMCVCSKPPIIAVGVVPTRLSHDLIKQGGEFVVNLAATDQAELALKVGRISGREVDKFSEFNIATLPAAKVRPPLIAGCATNFECKLVNSLTVGTNTLYIGEVLAMYVDEDKQPLARHRTKFRELGEQI